LTGQVAITMSAIAHLQQLDAEPPVYPPAAQSRLPGIMMALQRRKRSGMGRCLGKDSFPGPVLVESIGPFVFGHILTLHCVTGESFEPGFGVIHANQRFCTDLYRLEAVLLHLLVGGGATDPVETAEFIDSQSSLHECLSARAFRCGQTTIPFPWLCVGRQYRFRPLFKYRPLSVWLEFGQIARDTPLN
jgi:hypothetical protein